MRKIVAFIGRAGSGKDYQCSLLEQKGFKKVAFADCLREMTSEILGIPYDEMMRKYDYLKSHEVINGLTLRHIMERLGSYLRQIDEDFFVKALLKRINSGLINENICISDMRYPNEFRALYALDGWTSFECYFCDYRSDRYQENNTHESAKLSNALVALGYKDLQKLERMDIWRAQKYDSAI